VKEHIHVKDSDLRSLQNPGKDIHWNFISLLGPFFKRHFRKSFASLFLQSTAFAKEPSN